MKVYEEVREKLIKHPQYRERKNKTEFTAKWLMHKYPSLLSPISIRTLSEIINEVKTVDRSWRQVLQLEPVLRGKDYGKKEILEQEKQIELGYNPGQNS